MPPQDNYIAAVTTQLFQTQNLIQTLLEEIRENSTTQAALSAELKQLRLNVNILSNIIRGDDGNSKPLVMEVESLKFAGAHLDKRITLVVEDLEDQVSTIEKSVSGTIEKIQDDIVSQRKELEAKFELAEKQRRDYETARLQTQADEKKDIRLDGRSRFQTWSTIIIAIIATISTIVTIILK